MNIVSHRPTPRKEEDPMIDLPTPQFACDYCGHTFPLDSLAETPGGQRCPDCSVFLACGIDPRPWCPHCGRSLAVGVECGCQGYACAECGAKLPLEQLYVSVGGTAALCEVCWQVDALHSLVRSACQMLEGMVSLLEEVSRERIREIGC